MTDKAIDRWLWTAAIALAVALAADLLWRIHVSNKLLDEVWPPQTREVWP